MEKNRIKEIDIMRGIAIILVVLGHAIIVYPIDLHEIHWCNALFAWLSSVHMPLFFLLAGFCYSFKRVAGDAWGKSYRKYLQKKVKRLVIPYIIFCVFDIVTKVVFSGLVNHQRGIAESLKNMILFGGGYWFLYTLFIIFVIFPFLEKVIMKKNVIWMITVALLLVIRFADIAPELLELDSLAQYLPYFIAGYLTRKNQMAMQEYKNKAYRNRIGLIMGCSVIWIICIYLVCSVVNLDVFYFIASIAGILDSWLITSLIADKRNTFFCDCSTYSLQLYLLNGYFLVISRTIIVSKLGVESAVVIIAFNMLITLVLSLILIKYVLAKIKPVRFIMGIV